MFDGWTRWDGLGETFQSHQINFEGLATRGFLLQSLIDRFSILLHLPQVSVVAESPAGFVFKDQQCPEYDGYCWSRGYVFVLDSDVRIVLLVPQWFPHESRNFVVLDENSDDDDLLSSFCTLLCVLLTSEFYTMETVRSAVQR